MANTPPLAAFDDIHRSSKYCVDHEKNHTFSPSNRRLKRLQRGATSGQQWITICVSNDLNYSGVGISLLICQSQVRENKFSQRPSSPHSTDSSKPRKISSDSSTSLCIGTSPGADNSLGMLPYIGKSRPSSIRVSRLDAALAANSLIPDNSCRQA